MNCNQYSQHDVDVMSQLAKIRLKTKPLVNHYLLCIRYFVASLQWLHFPDKL